MTDNSDGLRHNLTILYNALRRAKTCIDADEKESAISDAEMAITVCELILAGEELYVIDPLGDKFDENKHVLFYRRKGGTGFPKGTIVQVIKAGFKNVNGETIERALVMVAK